MAKAKIYLYKEGNECTSLTGGIVGKYNTGGTYTLGTFSKQDKYISCVNNSTTKQVYVTSANKIDLTNYCNFICDFDVVNVRNTSSDVYKPTLTVRSNFTGSSDLLTRGELIAGLRQILTLDVTDINYSSNVCFQTHANDYNIYKMYLETKENVLTINSQENDVITFSAKDLGLVTINKIDVLVNGIVSKTYTDNYSNLSYTIDKSLYCIGNNNIEIRVTYSQGDDITETVSEYLTYKYDVSQLPLETPLLDTVERVKLLTKSKQNEKNLLSSILTSKNVEVSEEDKMSDLIGKVDLLGEYYDSILYLYKDGDECTDVTGGWSTTHTSSYYTVLPFTKESKNLLLNATNVATNTICLPNTVNLIDLTKYSKLKCEVEWVSSSRTLNSFGFRVTKTTTDDSELCVVAISNTKIGVGKFVCELDITNVTQGSVGFYLDQQLGTNNTGKIYKVWLEK